MQFVEDAESPVGWHRSHSTVLGRCKRTHGSLRNNFGRNIEGSVKNVVGEYTFTVMKYVRRLVDMLISEGD